MQQNKQLGTAKLMANFNLQLYSNNTHYLSMLDKYYLCFNSRECIGANAIFCSVNVPKKFCCNIFPTYVATYYVPSSLQSGSTNKHCLPIMFKHKMCVQVKKNIVHGTIFSQWILALILNIYIFLIFFSSFVSVPYSDHSWPLDL